MKKRLKALEERVLTETQKAMLINSNPAMENIDHSQTQARQRQTKGSGERFHKTVKQKFYNTTFRKKLYQSLEESP